jgi:phage-related tail fiber protein
MDGWTLSTLHEHLAAQIIDLRTMLDERYATQTKALDAAFVAQQTAMRTALESAEKAVATAMIAAEKAVTKAETAAEKRFEAVNEFRGQLADQASHFINRDEAEVRLQALVDKLHTVEATTARAVTQDQYGASHDSLRMMIDTERGSLAEHRTWDTKVQGDLGAALSNLRSRYAGVSVALGVIMTVLIVLVTVVQLTGK